MSDSHVSMMPMSYATQLSFLFGIGWFSTHKLLFLHACKDYKDKGKSSILAVALSWTGKEAKHSGLTEKPEQDHLPSRGLLRNRTKISDQRL